YGSHSGKSGSYIKVDDPVIGFSKRWRVLIAQAQIQGEVLARAPVVLNEKVEGVGVEVVILCAKLNRGLTGEAKQEIRKRQSGGAAVEIEGAARIAGVAHIQQLVAEVT